MAKLPHSSARRTISGMTASSTRKLIPQFVEPTCPWKNNMCPWLEFVLQGGRRAGEGRSVKGKVSGREREKTTGVRMPGGYLPKPTELPWVPLLVLLFLVLVSAVSVQTVPHHSKKRSSRLLNCHILSENNSNWTDSQFYDYEIHQHYNPNSKNTSFNFFTTICFTMY